MGFAQRKPLDFQQFQSRGIVQGTPLAAADTSKGKALRHSAQLHTRTTQNCSPLANVGFSNQSGEQFDSKRHRLQGQLFEPNPGFASSARPDGS